MSRRDKFNDFKPGTILVHETDDCFSFGSGNEHSRLIFMTLGSQRRSYHDYDTNQNEEVNESNAIDVFSGDCLGWGTHMFVTLDEFEDWINNFKFLLEETPELVRKIQQDNTQDMVCDRFEKERGMKCANAIIRHAQLILKGLENHRFRFPTNIRKAYSIIARNKRSEVSDSYYDELDSLQRKLYDRKDELTSEETASINARIEELQTLIKEFDLNPSDDEVNTVIEEQLVTALKRIASIEPFDCVDTMIKEEADRRKRYDEQQKEREKEEAEDEEEDSEEGHEDENALYDPTDDESGEES